MKRSNYESGFTIVEIIVVMIIIGVLASVALPNLFSNVQTSQGASALQTASVMKTPIEACVTKNSAVLPGAGACAFNTIMSNGNSATIAAAGSGFEIEVENAAGSASAGTLTYNLVAEDTGSVEAFDLQRKTTGVFTCTPGGTSYASVC